MRRWTWTSILAVGLILAIHAVAAACPMCKDSIPNSNSETPTGVPSGFNFSVYYMLISVFACMGLIIGIIYKGIRSSNQAAAGRGFPVTSQQN